MTKRSTKTSLLLSCLALLLCFSMLIGTTFAWFTDSVTSEGNIIQTGTLDIKMLYADGDEDPAAAKWNDASTGAIFNSKLWEPGYTDAKHINIINKGTLALKYQLLIEPTGEVSDLANVIDVYFIEGGKQLTRDALDTYAPQGTLADLIKGGIAFGSLTAGEDRIFTIVLKMQETAGNEYQDKSIGSDFAIKLLATQLASEEDSFGPDYDEDAWHPDMVVNNAADLIKAIQEIEEGGVIALAADLTFDANASYNNGGWIDGLYYEGDKSFTLDLNGNTITNDSAINDYLLNFKNAGDKANTITIKNGTLEAASSAYCAICTSTTSTQKITINLENVSLVNNNSNGAVAKIRGGAELNVKSGTIITGKNSYVGIEAVGTGTVVNFYDGAEIYQNGTSSYVGSLIGVSYSATVNVYGGYGKSAQGGFIAMTSGGTINVFGGEWIANTDGTYANSNRSVLIAQSNKAQYNGGNSVINVTGGTFNGGYNCYGNAVGDAQINISAGVFNADPADFVADGSKAFATNGKFVVVSDEVNSVASTPSELATAIAQGGIVYVADDIDMGNAWTSVKPGSALTILGNGNTITNLNKPLLTGGVSSKVTVKGLTIANSNVGAAAFENGLGSGAIIPYVDAYGNVAIEDCHLVNTTVIGNERVGGFVGYTSGQTVTIKNSSVTGCTLTAVGGAGALIGYAQSVVTVENSSVTDTKVTATEDRLGTKTPLAGAVIGTVNGNTTLTNVTVSNNTVSNNNALPVYSNCIGRKVSGNLLIDDKTAAADAESVIKALENGENVILMNDVTPSGDQSNGYGATGIAISGETLDGNGNSLGVNKWATWDSAINITGGTIKNLTVNSGMRGIFINHNGTAGKVYLENVVIDGTVYTISCDQGTNSGLEATNCTFNGWTSYAATLGDAKFVDCSFGEGQGNAYCRPYSSTEFVGCDFAEGFKFDASCASVTFENCTIGGVALTAENISSLVVSGVNNVTVQ